jgi:hypothetical protein
MGARPEFNTVPAEMQLPERKKICAGRVKEVRKKNLLPGFARKYTAALYLFFKRERQ